MTRRILLTIILLLIAATGLGIGYITWSARTADLDLASSAVGDDSFVSEDGDIIPLGNPPANLMFSSDIAGAWDVMLLDSEGNLNNLTDDGSGSQDIFASFSISGDQINFVANRANENALGPSQVNPDGSNLRTLPIITAIITLVQESKFDWDPVWSPDGERLVWSSLRDSNLELYTIALDDEIDFDNAERLTRGITNDWFAAWSPDGTRIVHNSNAGGTENIYLLDLETGESTQLTDGETDAMHGFWSLDGEKIYYIQENDALYQEGNLTVIEIKPDGSDAQTLNSTVQADPVWSPGATHLAFMSNAEGNWHIYVSQADGSNLRRVTDGDANYMFPVWMP